METVGLDDFSSSVNISSVLEEDLVVVVLLLLLLELELLLYKEEVTANIITNG